MGQRELEERIRADFKRDLDAIRKESEDMVERIRQELKTQADSQADRVRARGERKAALEYKRMVGQAKLNAVHTLGRRRNQLIDQVFEKARQEVLAMSDKKKGVYLGKLAEDAALIPGEHVIRIDDRYRRLFKAKVKGKVAADDLGDFGVIIESSDGTVRADNRLESLLNNAKARLKPQVNKLIFS
jgi:V/A-type H+-transporting ATPase subunit E